MIHAPVLLREVLEIFHPQPGQTYIDATVNGGGHARAIAQRAGERGKVLGIDWDCDLVRDARMRNQELKIANIDLACESYVNMKKIAEDHGIKAADGILFDLGFSSYHTDASGRGFSFQRDEPLDMRYNPVANQLTAERIVNDWPQDRIADILARYGEERYARRLAGSIVRARTRKQIASSAELAALVSSTLPRRNHIHPATRAFQALRIAVNGELDSLERVLPDAADLLLRGGRLAVISFHSLEDRIVKTFIREQEKRSVLRALSRKPITAAREEIVMNPRARSARLRAAVKI